MSSEKINWRWDQGRLEYFRFETIRTMSRVLLEKNRMSLYDPEEDADLRQKMRRVAKVEFLPIKSGYAVWRNYGRVFKSALLATDIDGRLVCTDICRALARDEIDSVADYVLHLARVFYLNGPVFDARKYDPQDAHIFPFCAAIKLAIVRSATEANAAGVSVEDIRDFLFASQSTGREDWEYYASLRKSPVDWSARDQRRQIREMLIFVGQMPFLKWDGKRLSLDMPQGADESALRDMFACISPLSRKKSKFPSEEILNMGGIAEPFGVFDFGLTEVITARDLVFGEGGRKMANHVIIERSSKLRRWYFSQIKSPICDITGNPANAGFPWVDNILEIHHVVPLSSSLHIDLRGTVFDDLVALTPTSHRAIHAYYGRWLRRKKRKDFSDKAEAWRVYESAKAKYRAHAGGKAV